MLSSFIQRPGLAVLLYSSHCGLRRRVSCQCVLHYCEGCLILFLHRDAENGDLLFHVGDIIQVPAEEHKNMVFSDLFVFT
jgi:hypothetical protein